MIATTHLTPADFRSRAFENLIEELKHRIATLREENDSFSDHDTTTKRRGRIAELKEWLDLARQAQLADRSPDNGLWSLPPQAY